MSRIRYREIAADLRRRIDGAEFAAGRVLPSEAELGRAYDVSRVTIRKALDHLRGEGRVDSRQGFGWFVATEPVPQGLAHLHTIEEQLEASGAVPERRVLSFAFVATPPAVRAWLDTDTVLEVERVNLADGEPFARVTVWCPQSVADELSRADVERATFAELLEADLGGATQTIGATLAGARDAEVLHVPDGSPLLRCERRTRDDAGRPVLMSEHRFPAHRTEFVVELPVVDRSIAPTGLHLVGSRPG